MVKMHDAAYDMVLLKYWKQGYIQHNGEICIGVICIGIMLSQNDENLNLLLHRRVHSHHISWTDTVKINEFIFR